MKCKIMQFMMMMMEVQEDRRKRYEADKGRRRKMRRESGKRRKKGGGEREEEEEDIADFSSAIVRPDSISSRETRTHRCAPCSEHAWGKHRFLQKNGYLLRGSKEAGTCS